MDALCGLAVAVLVVGLDKDLQRERLDVRRGSSIVVDSRMLRELSFALCGGSPVW